MPTILVTDNLFIFDEHIRKFKDAGFEVFRLNKTTPSEDELCEAVKGKAGYIIGGLEKVTEKVIDAADELKVITFTGIGYQAFIPAWRYALEKGIAITNIPEGPTQAVAEWAIGAALLMNREFLSFGKFGKKGFEVTKGIEGQVVGLVGLGRINSRITEMLKAFKPKEVNYFSRHTHPDLEKQLNVRYLELDDLLNSSDIVFLGVSDEGGKGLFNKEKIGKMKPNSLIVNYTHPGVIDEESLYEAISAGKVRAISDFPMTNQFDNLSVDRWYCFKSSNTVTEGEAKLASDIATNSVINLLQRKPDKYLIKSES